MSEEEITALAREYAEECCPKSDYKEDIEWRKEDIKHETSCTETFLTWLLRRYALVEKSKVKDEYEKAKMDMVSKYHQGSMVVLQVLFPEIAKEVEE